MLIQTFFILAFVEVSDESEHNMLEPCFDLQQARFLAVQSVRLDFQFDLLIN